MNYKDYHTRETPREEGTVIDGLKEGVWKEFYSSGKIKVIQNYEKGEKHGVFEFYKETGELDFKVTYQHGRIKIMTSKIKGLK
jgi:antitoxin component YwqK of YwqJK toxin-antitoxin module